eukprot:Seg1622.15 transcript_id=Seg1622.15/GoldUCD/mRNA.D3Y31 product="hypothetical protein" protein_id=Seg1622.15/GoldUCD/D3Y31
MTIKISGEGKKAAGKDNMASSGREKKNSGNGILSKLRKKISRNKSQEKPELDYNATQDKDTNRTLILSHSSDHDIVTGLKEALERADEVKLKRMEDIRAESSKPNTDEDTNNLIEEMKSLNGVLVLCTEKMVELLNDNNTKETKEFEVSGEGITLKIELLKSAIDGSLKKKMIPFKILGVAGSLPECLNRIDLLDITQDDLDDEVENIYDDMVGLIISRLKETKSSLISQKSIEEK